MNVAPSGTSAIVASVFDTGTFDSMLFDGNGNITASGSGLTTLQVNAFESLIEFGGPI